MNAKLWIICLLGIVKISAQQPIVIHVKLSGAPKDAKAYFSRFTDDGSWKNDVVTLADGRFDYKLSGSHSVQLHLFNSKGLNANDKEMAVVYADPGEQSLEGAFADMATVKVHGSKTQDEADALQLQLHRFKDAQDELLARYKPDLDAFTNTKDDLTRQELGPKVDQYCTLFDKLKVDELLMELQFFKAHPDSFVAVPTLSMRMGQSALVTQREQIAATARQLSAKLKATKPGQLLMQRISFYESSKVGAMAADFNLQDINGQPVALSGFRNKKYVLLDFWASYCSPCRAEYPDLKEIFAAYPNLAVVNLSQDKDLVSWKSAIAKDEIGGWTHISLVQNNATAISDQYNVIFIPVKILIDPTGKIIARWEGSGQVESLRKQLQTLLN